MPREENQHRPQIDEATEIALNERLARAMQLCAEEGIDIPDDCGLSRERVRAIYSKLRYGSEPISKTAEYYGIPVKLAILIKEGKAFKRFTEDLQ